MDRNQQPPLTQLAPAHLFVGSPDTLVEHTHEFLKHTLCTHGGCSTCTTCIGLRTHQHHHVLWLSSPAKPYTRESIEDIFSTITLQLDNDQHYFFVIQDAHMLTQATANSLLKSIEEPPAGYHFIFLTHHPDRMLGTITSRCVTTIVSHVIEGDIQYPMLFAKFTSIENPHPLTFLSVLDQSPINEHESGELLDALLAYWLKKHKEELVHEGDATSQGNATSRSTHMIALLQQAMDQKPMPGSSKIFWKNLFLQMVSGK